MSNILLLIFYCILVAGVSFAGGILPSLIRLTHTRIQLMMSFVGGLMMGVAVLHMLPHGIEQSKSIHGVARSAVLGLLAMFFLIRIFHVHQHSHGDETLGDEDTCQHRHDHEHNHEPESNARSYSHPLSWVGLFVGLTIHTLIDGMALGASVGAAQHATGTFGIIGMSTFLAIFLHKPLDALSITTVMASGGWSRSARMVASALFAMMCPLGAFTFFFSLSYMGGVQETVLGFALGFSAGVFLCISLGDILPELQFHRHDRLKLSVALLLGVLLAFAVGLMEPRHDHATHGNTAESVRPDRQIGT